MTASALAGRLVERIRREGPLPFDRFMDAALYDDGGFFARGAGAGRSGRDFVTSPEVGSLFGALVARALDGWWDRLGCPDPYLVIDAGAGRGQLARDVLRSAPRCAPALRYVLVERSAALRAEHHDRLPLEPAEEVLGPVVRGDPEEPPEAVPGLGPVVTSLPDLPAGPFRGVIVANELADNLPVAIVARSAAGWDEVRVGWDGGQFVEVIVPAPPMLAADIDALVARDTVAVGARLPVPCGLASWVQACATVVRRGVVVVIDYADTLASMAGRGQRSWLRTYAGHARAGDPLAAPGTCDITCDVAVDALRRLAERHGFTVECEIEQAQWLESLGVGVLVDEARATWRERAHTGDLPALAARSRVSEADALLDPSGLGAHRVVVLAKGM